MIFDENIAYVDDSFEGDAITIVSNVGGRKDRKFSRNYAWAKHAADRGRLSSIVIKVGANGETFRTIDTFRRAVGSPHGAASVRLDGPDDRHTAEVLAGIKQFAPGAEMWAGEPDPKLIKPVRRIRRPRKNETPEPKLSPYPVEERALEGIDDVVVIVSNE